MFYFQMLCTLQLVLFLYHKEPELFQIQPWYPPSNPLKLKLVCIMNFFADNECLLYVGRDWLSSSCAEPQTNAIKKIMGKAIARKSKATIVRECLKDPIMFNYVISNVSRILQSELRKMCSTEANSALKQHLPRNFQDFTWNVLIKEAQVHAPVLLALMKACNKTKSPRSNRIGIIGFCIAILLKFHCVKMSLVQKILSLILYAGHSGKQVCDFKHVTMILHMYVGISVAAKA